MKKIVIIIMSLWQVPDKETSEFKKTFYSKWLSGRDIETSFTLTQHEMQKNIQTLLNGLSLRLMNKSI